MTAATKPRAPVVYVAAALLSVYLIWGHTMNKASIFSGNTLSLILLGVLAAVVVAGSLARIKLPLIGSDRTAFNALAVIGLVMCSLGMQFLELTGRTRRHHGALSLDGATDGPTNCVRRRRVSGRTHSCR
jgi:UDP-N-acetylmuramyl pentapeptide phosphotransferase/UDP-N-acetylglucosamine-1-phosphate transferase